MALKKISELTELTESPALGDLMVLVDISEPFDVNKTKKIKFSTLINLAAQTIITGQTEGDLFYASGSQAVSRLGIGTSGYGLIADSTPKWAARKWSVAFPIGNGVDVITTGLKYAVEIPANCYIDRVSLLSVINIQGSIVVNIWKADYANLPATSANKITASTPPTINNAKKSEDTTMTDWTRTINAGDWLYINVDSISSLKSVVLNISGHQLP